MKTMVKRISLKDEKQKELIGKIMKRAYEIYESEGGQKTAAINKAREEFRNEEKYETLPETQALTDWLRDIDEGVKNGEPKERRTTVKIRARTIVTEEIVREILEERKQLPGQMKMELEPAEEPKSEMSDQTKMMRFQAHLADRIIAAGQEETKDTIAMLVRINTNLEKLNDKMSQILRCVGSEKG